MYENVCWHSVPLNLRPTLTLSARFMYPLALFLSPSPRPISWHTGSLQPAQKRSCIVSLQCILHLTHSAAPVPVQMLSYFHQLFKLNCIKWWCQVVYYRTAMLNHSYGYYYCTGLLYIILLHTTVVVIFLLLLFICISLILLFLFYTAGWIFFFSKNQQRLWISL